LFSRLLINLPLSEKASTCFILYFDSYLKGCQFPVAATFPPYTIAILRRAPRINMLPPEYKTDFAVFTPLYYQLSHSKKHLIPVNNILLQP